MSGNKLALALETQALLLRLAHDDEQARPIAERAHRFRALIIEQMQKTQAPSAPAETQPNPAGALKIGGGVSAPSVVSRIEPEYSSAARLAKYQGTSVLSIVVDLRGLPERIRLVRSLGFDLDEKAYEAVSQWRFKPGMKDGQPVAVFAVIEVNFRLL
ncbi:MAG: energy transducer TonB [Bryobacteraceae bacterium]